MLPYSILSRQTFFIVEREPPNFKCSCGDREIFSA